MKILRPAEQRGKANFGWLDSRHSFSFGHYYDPNHMGFGPLRVINEDKVSPGAGFASAASGSGSGSGSASVAGGGTNGCGG